MFMILASLSVVIFCSFIAYTVITAFPETDFRKLYPKEKQIYFRIYEAISGTIIFFTFAGFAHFTLLTDVFELSEKLMIGSFYALGFFALGMIIYDETKKKAPLTEQLELEF